MWWRVTIITLAYLLLGAHFLRYGQELICLAYASAPLVLFIKRVELTRLLQIVLAISAVLVWGVSSYDYVQMRIAMDAPWYRLSIIMSSVTVFTLLASLCCSGVIAKRTKISH
ncbi:hypothetical protein [Shewanella woodyi]|uniref:Inner membrane protein n=1 Tax=Shewanella woodyi (strain ATCC 51908 / MS32) TaxID=392500 RepID=B1KJ55_SHEWM|nr:hypothetical protein [Shewanella woodyi]ACA87075.1 conserved hypothetical protein [Shewanella woodyi ATCC 51908]